jgi:hypothetical protein
MLLIEKQKQSLKQITYDNENESKIVEGHEKNHRKQLKRRDTVYEMKIIELTTEIKTKDKEIERMNKTINTAISIPNSQTIISGGDFSGNFSNIGGTVAGDTNFSNQITTSNPI